MSKIDFDSWSLEFEKVWNLKTDSDCKKFSELTYSLKGNEGVRFLEKLIDSVKLKDDFGLYESLYNAIWLFPDNIIGQVLAKKLPEFQKRMGKHDQILRFYLPIPNNKNVLNSFLKEANKWSTSEKRTAISAIKKWVIEIEDWESILEKLGKPITKRKEDPIPEEWNENWKIKLQKGREKGGEFCISEILWKGGKKQWLEDLDFLIEMLSLNHGKHWRQIDNMTNPLWMYAKRIVYPTFVDTLKKIPLEKQNKILENIKRVNKHKYKTLNEEINGS
ncbi:hypothetical protein [Tenacibaculum finnmarkense]|uniref:hypothetical protein n=1 Tax=Tenacibaculum finnmarkense TaxID=2781243 RepID=UPI001E48577C|nr:hypothetical protein [Tenacibaculum finnmarkense]MCD8401424.1 hypothetical protein [Tenacibaculum finnmarkense genomovar ulcerans]MCD8423607.1 hypothetical protein [Tenacibaculum finnmarkense genomovar ulcerans]MCD8433627.1 hypothetical protein [Tenacibaculum finnmarkense genomovar ulcerans]MCG8239716.1 hypothetical protein [Tenacibaculum finnmarkense genomovar ulcerans]MCG8796686.1 hypothetical protein [Tenacibaculum finnmarkense]